jgi:hypothetical protein
MTANPPNTKTPTPAQLRYLKGLAEQAGQTVALPRTRHQASSLITQLRTTIARGGGPAERAEEARRDREAVTTDLQTGTGDATRFQPEETSGYGANASWTNTDNREQVISSHPTPVRLIPQLGPRKQLACYTTASGDQRVLWGRRINGIARITDRPASDRIVGRDRAHLVATNLTSRNQMNAAITAWLGKAQRLGVVPAEAIPYDHFLAQLRQQQRKTTPAR